MSDHDTHEGTGKGTTPVNKSWLTTGKNRHNPQPLMYPVCETCGTAWAYKRFISLSTGGYLWAWGRDCKHRGVPKTQDERPHSVSEDAQ